MAARGMYILGRKCTERLPTPPTEPPHGMDDWFQIHSFIMSYLNAFQYAIATEGDGGLKEQYTRYVTRCAHSFRRHQTGLADLFLWCRLVNRASWQKHRDCRMRRGSRG